MYHCKATQYFPLSRVHSSSLSIVVCAHRAPRRDTTSPHGSSQALLHDNYFEEEEEWDMMTSSVFRTKVGRSKGELRNFMHSVLLEIISLW